MSDQTAIAKDDKAEAGQSAAKPRPADLDRVVADTKTLSEDVAEWLRLKVQLIQIEVHQRIQDEINALVSTIVILVVLGVALLLGLTALAHFFGRLMDNTASGFAIVSVATFLIGLLLARSQPKWVGEAFYTLVPRRWLKRIKSKNDAS